MKKPAWDTLSNITGTCSIAYPESDRKEIYQLFDHQPQRVLDIGCATGYVGRALKERYKEVWVWGCDLDADAVKRAATHLDYVSASSIQDLTSKELAFLNDVDTILLLDVLEHMYNPWGYLQYLSNHINTKTQLIVSLPNIAHASILQSLANGLWEYRPLGILDITHIRFFTLQQMQKMFFETGYKIEKQVSLSGKVPQQVERFPITLDMGIMKITVKDLEHWQSLFTIQYGFRLRKNL